jgi:hypothetical protein
MYMHTSINGNLWKLDFIYAHIRKPSSINVHLQMTDFVYAHLWKTTSLNILARDAWPYTLLPPKPLLYVIKS